MIATENTERSKQQIIDDLKGIRRARKPLEQIKLLIDHLEGEAFLKKEFHLKDKRQETYRTNQTRYKDFCKIYLKTLLEEFIVELDDLEIMLAIYRYDTKYAQIGKLCDIRYQFACDTYINKHPEKNWGAKKTDKARGMSEEEDRIIEELADALVKVAVKNKGKLGLANNILAKNNSTNGTGNNKTIKQHVSNSATEETVTFQQDELQALETDDQDRFQTSLEDNPQDESFDDNNPEKNFGILNTEKSLTNQPIENYGSKQHDNEEQRQSRIDFTVILELLMKPINPLPLYITVFLEFFIILGLIFVLCLHALYPVRSDLKYSHGTTPYPYSESTNHSMD